MGVGEKGSAIVDLSRQRTLFLSPDNSSVRRDNRHQKMSGY